MKKKLKVLQVNKLYYPINGGIEKVVQDLSEGLSHVPYIDNQVLVCQPKGRGIEEIVNGVRVTRCSSLGTLCSLPISIEFLWKFRQLSKTTDIIHIHVPFPLGDLACLLSGYKGMVVIWWHSDVIRQKKLMKLYYPFMIQFLKRADAIIVATEGHITGSSYLEPYRDKCHVISYGIDPYLMKDARKRHIQIQTAPELTRPLHYLFAGRLVYYKGCDILIQAFSKLKEENAVLSIVGEGPLRENLEQSARDLGISSKVTFMGEVSREQLYDCFAECDVFVLPSVAKSEAFGIVQIEAMSYGKPVINTNLANGVPFVSEHGKTGLTVEPNNVTALSEAMLWMIRHPEKRLEYGKNAQDKAENYYEMDRMLEKVESLYLKLCDNKNCEV